MRIRTVGIIGLGTMGAGIAEVFARGGLPVTAVEVDPQALVQGIATLDASLGKAVIKGRLTEDERAEIIGRVNAGAKLPELAGVDLVIEVVPEQLAIKRKVLAELDQICRPDAIIATNTSSLSVTAIAGGSAHPGRVVGMHFFNPAPVMRLVEVVTTVLTDKAVAAAVTDLAGRLGKTPVQVTDRAGFVANALLLPYLNHAVRLLETGYASRDDIELAATEGIGLPMGPLRLLDLIGLDTSLSILEVLQREFGGTRYTPSPLLRRMTDAGRVGRKSGSGFFDYQSSTSTGGNSPDYPNVNQPRAPGTVTLIDPVVPAGTAADGSGDRSAELASMLAAAGINVTRNPAHSTELAIVAIGPKGGVLGPAMAAGHTADAVGLHLPASTPKSDKPKSNYRTSDYRTSDYRTSSNRTSDSRMSGYRTSDNRDSGLGLAEVAPSPLSSAAAVDAARAVAAKLGLRTVVTADRPGLLVGALLYPHLRDAVAMVADGYATPKDVDAAMTLGCGYPHGPMRMLADEGLARVADVLAAMHAAYGDPAYSPPPLLTDLALAGVPLDGATKGQPVQHQTARR
jgi:3-hydroxybutyryl-CoA dehydrogenase